MTANTTSLTPADNPRHADICIPRKRPSEPRKPSIGPSPALSEAPTEADYPEEEIPQLELHSDFNYVRTAEFPQQNVVDTSTKDSLVPEEKNTNDSARVGNESVPPNKAPPAKLHTAPSTRCHPESHFSNHLPAFPSVLMTAVRDLVLGTAGRLLYPIR